jgi:type I restriction enzyme S subunit
MEKLKNIPSLRFPEFKDSLEKSIIGQVANLTTGNKDTQNKIEDGEFPFFVRSQTIERINSYSFDGEAILTSGDGVGVGKNFHYINGKFDYHQRVYCLSGFNKNIIGKFVFYYFSENFNRRIMRMSAKNSVDSVRRDMIFEMEINIPSVKEQTKIASFLTAVDDKLQTLKQKKTLLEQYKKGVMQKIFSQELRFKDDNGNEYPDWEETKVKDIFMVTRGNVLSMTLVTNEQDENNLFPVYSSQTKNNGLSGYYDKFLFEDCITWTTDGAGAGDVNFRKGKFYCTNVCGVLKSDKGYANTFVAEILNSVSRKYVSYVGNPKLMNNVMSEIQISIPKSIKEQTKIANFLSAIDDKINHCQVQIEKMEVWKKGLLQQMFC